MASETRLISSSSSSEDNVNRTMDGSQTVNQDVATSDKDKKDILDLLKMSYIVVRTGIGTGQIMVLGSLRIK